MFDISKGEIFKGATFNKGVKSSAHLSFAGIEEEIKWRECVTFFWRLVIRETLGQSRGKSFHKSIPLKCSKARII